MGVQPAPAVARIAQLLNAIAQAPGDGRTLAELSRQTGVRKPTAHSLLLALTAEGFVQRVGPEPTYRLGPALVALGSAARGSMTLLAVVAPELERLHDQLQLSAMAATVESDEVVVLAARSVPHPFGLKVAEGSRTPLRAPLGTVYVAWTDSASTQDWCERAEPRLNPRRRRAVMRDLELVRERGWSATIRDGASGIEGVREVTEPELEQPGLSVVGVSAPVFDDSGRLACAIALVGFDRPLDGTALCELANLVVGAAQRATSTMGGTAPES